MKKRTDMVTLEQLKTMLHEERVKCELIGIEFPRCSDPKVEIGRMQTFYAYAYPGWWIVRVSKYFLNAPVEDIRATLMHEMLHMAKNAGNGHDAKWKHLADLVNKAYPQYNIKRVGSQRSGSHPEFPLRSTAREEINKKRANKSKIERPAANRIAEYAVACPSCGRTWYRTRLTNLITNPGSYNCKRCHINLVSAKS